MAEAVGQEQSVTAADTDRLVELRQLLEFGKDFRQEARESAWRQSEAQYLGKHWSITERDDPTADLITINLSFSTVNTIIPYVTSEEPRFLINPYSKDATVRNARLQQAWLNRLWRRQETGAHEAIESAAEDYLIYGDGYGKVSWALTDKMKGDGQEDSVTVAEIFVDRVDPWDLWIDPMADGLHNARWVAHRIYSTLEEIEADERYDTKAIDDLNASSIDAIDDEDRGARTAAHAESVQNWVKIYEFYDLVAMEMWTFGDAGDRPLRIVRDIDMAPIVQMGNYRIPRSPYHMSELEQMWPMQQELNKSRSQLITHRRRNVAKYLIRQDAITEAGRTALQSPIVGEFVPVVGEVPLDQLVKPAQLAPLPPEAYASSDQATRDIYEISGVNEYLRGATPEVRRTATEASIIEGASNVKTRAKLMDIERAVRKLGTLIVETAKDIYPETDIDEMSMFLTGNEAEKIARGDAAAAADEQFQADGDLLAAQNTMALGGMSDVIVTPTEEIFQGVYEVEVEAGSTEMRSPAFKEQKFRDMAQALTQSYEMLTQAGVNINLQKVYELWFEAAQISDVDGMFVSPGDQAMQQPMQGVGPSGMPPELMGMEGMPPEMAAMGIGPPGGIQPGEGQPNLGNARAPAAPITDENTGALPPPM